MSGPKYFSYKDYGLTLLEEMHYSQAVRVGENIEISGQGNYPTPLTNIPHIRTFRKSRIVNHITFFKLSQHFLSASKQRHFFRISYLLHYEVVYRV
ncbi:hypothetical protein LZ31DRAFT_559786 [Colletotrichum somersetense]|nr:hypothetical protein LZ31DRAFT_559786 [Colletotrichum somersetense]